MVFWRKKRKEEFYRDPLEEISRADKEKQKILAIITYLTDGILVFDKNSRVSLINPQAEKLLDVRKEKVLGEQILNLSRFPNFQPLISLLGGGIKEVHEKELKIQENFILEVSAVSMIIRGEKIGSLVILHDISQEKLVEKMKSEFVTVAAHQLRTPASAVKWTTQMLLSGDLGGLTKEQREALEKAYKTHDKMIKLINDLLNVAEIEEGRYLSKLVLSDIEEVIQSLIDTYKKRAEQKKIKFEFQKPEGKLPKLMLDVGKIKIAIGVILDNAVRYTLSGGQVVISLKIEQREGEEEILIQIKDSGLGIPQDQKNKVFTKFFRGSNIMKVETEGTGLGLYIAKNIIEAHGGRIWFESQEGRGSIFYFTLPVKEKFGEFVTGEFY